MFAVSRSIYLFLSILMVLTVSACSESGGGSSSSIDDRELVPGVANSIMEGAEDEKTTLAIVFESPVTGLVSYSSFNITAAEKSDYASVDGQLDVVEGEEYVIEVDVYGDEQIEGDEIVGVSVTQDNVEVAELYGHIINDDFPAINISTTSVLEGDAGTSLLRFTFSLASDTVDNYTFLITTPVVSLDENDPENSIFFAVPGEDFIAIDESIIFSAEQPEVFIDVVVHADNIIEMDESIKIQASPLDAQGQSITEAIGTIRTDDSIDSDGFDLSAKSSSQDEGNDEAQQWYEVVYTVAVENPENIIDDQVVQILLEGSAAYEGESWATLAEDFCANKPEVVAGTDELLQCDSVASFDLVAGTENFDVSFYVKADLNVEAGDEDIKITLQNDQGIVFAELFHTINEDDYPVIMVSYSANGAEVVTQEFTELIESGIQVLESPDNTVLDIGLSLQYSQDANYSLVYEISNDQSTTIDGSDYSLSDSQNLSDTITINSGDTLGITLNLNIDDDGSYEGIERFNLEIDGIGSLPISITDNDLPGMELKTTGGDSVAEDGLLDSIALNEESTTLHEFNLVLEDSLVALSAFDFHYTVGTQFFTDKKSEIEGLTDCGYLKDGNLKRQAGYGYDPDNNTELDYRIYINDELAEPGVAKDFAIGQSSVSLAIELNNDTSVECLEFLPLSFVLTPSLEGAVSGDALNKTFAIANTDKATLKISSWEVTEADADQTQSFDANLNQAVIAAVSASFGTSGHVCNTSSDASLIGDTYSLDGVNTELSQQVTIKGGVVVEPDETCEFTVTEDQGDYDILDIFYCDTLGQNCTVSTAPDSAAIGHIIDNDKLVFSFNTTTAVTEPVADSDAPVSLGSIIWSKEIAANVDDIQVTLTKASCIDGENHDCAEAVDIEFQNTSNSILNIKSGSTILTSPLDIGIAVVGDDLLENTEQLIFNVTQTAVNGSAYINTLPETLARSIINEDALLVSLNKITDESTCSVDTKELDGGNDCQLIYSVDLNKDLSNTLSEMSVLLSVSDLNTVNIQAGDTVGKYDDVVVEVNDSIINFVNGEYSLTLINNDGEAVTNVLTVTIKADSVVEIDESLSLGLGNTPNETRYAVSDTANSITRLITNDDLIDLVVTGATTVSEPDETMTPFTLSWSQDIDIANENDHPLLTYKIRETCTDTDSTECLHESTDYILEKDDQGESLTESQIRLNSVGQSIAMDYLKLTEVDGIVELPEYVKLTLLKSSPLIESITHNLGTPDNNADDISAITNIDTGITNLDWDLTVESEDRLTVEVINPISSLDEFCDTSLDANCMTQSVAAIKLTGSVATNGPTIKLDLSNSCVADDTNSDDCALASTEKDANPSEQDYVFNHQNNQITLHAHGTEYNSNSQTVDFVLANDSWVEVAEKINLLISLSAGTEDYVTKIGGDDWSYEQKIILNSEDTASISLVRDTDNSTCSLTGITFTEDESTDADPCYSKYILSSDVSIAKEVPSLSAKITRQVDTTATNFSFKSDKDDVLYDAMYMLDATEDYEFNSSFSLPIHSNTEITESGDLSAISVVYSQDIRVEIDETLDYLLEKDTASTLYSVVNGNVSYAINETIKNDDFINLSVIGSNEQNEPSSALKPYTLSWEGALELVNLPSITLSNPQIPTDQCTETLECMESGADYSLDPDSSIVTLPIDVTTLALDYLTLNAIDDLVELPEQMALTLTTDSPYIKTITNTNGTADTADDSTADVSADDVNSLSWTLKVNSQEKLVVDISAPAATVSEYCDTSSDLDCATKTLGSVSVTGPVTVASNGPTITLAVANTACVVDTDSTPPNYCASPLSFATALNTEETISSSEKDFAFTEDYASLDLHTYGENYTALDKNIDATFNNDNWVEVSENIKLVYTATEGAGYIDSARSLPISQDITLTSDDIAEVTIARDNSSSCEFETGKANNTSFTESNCGSKSSQYDLTLSHSIAKEVESLNVALLVADTSGVTFKASAHLTEGFDLAAILNNSAQSDVLSQPDANKKLYLPVHTQQSETEKALLVSNIKLEFIDDPESESDEPFDFSLIKETNSTLYSVPTGAEALAFNETILNDDSVLFSLTGYSGSQSASENNIDDTSTNTKYTYTLTWDREIAADAGDLTFDFKLADTDTALLGSDYKINKVPNSKLTIDGSTLVFSTGGIAVGNGSENIIFEIIGDELVEIDETINATLAITDAATSEVAGIGSANKAVDIEIPNEDFVTVTLHSIDAEEGNSLVAQAAQPFSYTLDKNIAANVPTIELYMDASQCTNSDDINCVEYSNADPVPESNDYSFGAVAATQLVTLHTGPVLNNEGELVSAGIATEKSATDPDTSELIATSLPITYVVDERVEAYETLILEFNKGNDGTANTNEAGRDFIKTILDGDSVEPAPVDPVNELTLSNEIQNDDKFSVYITQVEDKCSLEGGSCDFEVSWFYSNFDMAPVLESVTAASDAENSLVTVISDTNAQATSTNNTADTISTPWWWDNWNVDTEISLAEAELTDANVAKKSAQDQIDEADKTITAASSAMTSVQATEQVDIATNAKNAAEAARSAAVSAKSAANAAKAAANAALNALEEAKRADKGEGDLDEAKDAAEAATAAAKAATAQADIVTSVAEQAIEKANLAVSVALQTTANPIIDTDAGEISLSMTLAGSAMNVSTPRSDVDDTEIDPQDYKINLEDISDGSLTEQGNNKIILKNADEAMVDLPRTLSLAVLNDDFMEPDETISMTLNPIAVDAHELIAAFAGATYSSTVLANDAATITVSAPQNNDEDITSGNEDSTDGEGNPINTVLAYDVTTSNPIANNAPSITLGVTPANVDDDGYIDGSTNMAAIRAEDFTIENLRIHTYNGGETLASDSDLELTIKTDNTLELSELVQIDLALTANTATLAGLNQINYTINNDDVLTINVTGVSGVAVDEATSNALTYTLTGANIADGSQELLVASNYPTIAFTQAISGTATATGASADFSAPANFNVHTQGTPKNNGASTTADLSIVNDTIVEQDETIIFAFSENASADDVIITVNDEDTSAFTYYIKNNDFINIDFRCDTGTCDGSLSEAGTINNNNSLQVVVLSDYVSQGLSADERTVTFNVSGADAGSAEEGSGKDYQLAPVELPESASADDDAGSIISVDNDDAIEIEENFNIEKAHSSFITTDYAQTAYTIESNDYLTVNLETTEPTSDTTNYNLKVCRPTADPIQGGNIELTTTLLKVQDGSDQVINDVTQLSCADIGLESGIDAQCTDNLSGNIAEFENTIVAADVVECGSTTDTTLFTFTTHDTIQTNKWFNMAITSDERCNADACTPATDVVVLNNQLSTVLDTGLTQCLESGLDKRWAIDCASVSSGFEKQDAVQTDGTNNLYPDLAYTFVNGDGQPVAERPDSGEVCVQDNNTGFIWSGTVLDSGNSYANTRRYSAYGAIGERADYDCNLSGAGSWQLPSVQDLMSIMDIENLKKTRDLGVRFTDSAGDDIAEVSVQFNADARRPNFASYWTSTICENNSYFTLNFLNGELVCAHKNDNHSIMMLYK
jgi:hypothetical protein